MVGRRWFSEVKYPISIATAQLQFSVTNPVLPDLPFFKRSQESMHLTKFLKYWAGKQAYLKTRCSSIISLWPLYWNLPGPQPYVEIKKKVFETTRIVGHKEGAELLQIPVGCQVEMIYGLFSFQKSEQGLVGKTVRRQILLKAAATEQTRNSIGCIIGISVFRRWYSSHW